MAEYSSSTVDEELEADEYEYSDEESEDETVEIDADYDGDDLRVRFPAFDELRRLHFAVLHMSSYFSPLLRPWEAHGSQGRVSDTPKLASRGPATR